ncbi:SDR family NAD(P)-dependent oxidoreductase [Nocardia stercoris]|uniref:SDR family NAD(P)-dependent oxidoreductase n=1 Tax=Nocardia stercoris TaxID=2483361 RepID=A0A3M2KUI1_9NOCA|nr:SDR family NAD(P)-dependent oxidoreductase [Nocardia stercoris]
MDLRGARVLLTGATGGIGHAIARALHAQGAVLTITGRRTEALDALAAELSATALAADLARPEAPQELLEQAGRVDVLIANAALPGVGPLTEFSTEKLDSNLAVNLRAPIILARSVLPGMLERGSGHLVFIGSVSGLTASPGGSIYSATKFGLRGLAAGLRQDLHGTGVGVSLVMPGFVRDAGMFVDSGMQLPPGVRTVSPERVAGCVVRAVRRDKGEIVAAPLEMRIAARLGSVAPGLNAAVQRMAGAADITATHTGTR